MSAINRLTVVSRDGRTIQAAFEYSELLKKLGVNLKPVDPTEGKIIIFAIHRNTHIGSIILETMLTEIEKYGFPIDGAYRSYFMSTIERAKMSPYFEKANVVLLLDHPEISHDVDLYPELQNLWTKKPSQ